MPHRSKQKRSCYCNGSPKCSSITIGKQNQCCYCSDKRTPEEKSNPEVYIDGVGTLYPKNYNIRWPFDIGYCPDCRQSRISNSVLYDRLKQVHDLLDKFN